MKKKVHFFALALCAISLSLSLASCGKFDDWFGWMDASESSRHMQTSSSKHEDSSSEIEVEETYLLSKVWGQDDYKFTVSPSIARVYVGESFDVTAALETGEALTFKLYEVAGAGYISIEGETVTALKEGKTSIVMREYSVEELPPILIEVEIIARTE